MKKTITIIATIAYCLLVIGTVKGQTNPSPALLSNLYAQSFSLAATSTTYPVGWQGWTVGTTSGATFRTTDPTADAAMIASSGASIATGGVHNYNGKIGMLASGSTDPSICFAISTSSRSDVKVNFDLMTIRNPYDGAANTRINAVDLQYRVGTSGAFTSVTGIANGIYQNNTTTQVGSGVTTPQNVQAIAITLPAACDGQANIQLRLVQRDISGVGSRPSFAIDNVTIVANLPKITSFAPASGAIGSSVVITGTGFSATASQNTVFFGATKATVTATSTTSLTVTVPIGATYQNISVRNSVFGLTGYSSKPFIVTLAGNIAFANKQNIATGTNSNSVCLGDIDGDGKPDMAVANTGNNTVSVYRNISTSGTIVYATKVDFTTGSFPVSVVIGDVNGDGKPDLVVANQSSNTVSYFVNTSVSGTVNFNPKVDLATGSAPNMASIGDIDGDGKPEIVVANISSSTISVFQYSFGTYAPAVNYSVGSNPMSVTIGDIDGDNKPDLVSANSSSANVSVLRNTSTLGTINFAGVVNFTAGTNPMYACIGDLDGDGKPDLAVANQGSATVSVLRNNSTSGTIAFIPKVDFTTGTQPNTVIIGDIDGDGKPDMAVANQGSASTSMLANTSTSGTISFLPKADFGTNSPPVSVFIGDIDGDGKPDVSVATYGGTISILKQIIPFTITNFAPATGAIGSSVTITGTGFNTTANQNIVFFGATQATVTAASNTSLTVTVPIGATYENISVTNLSANLTRYTSNPFNVTLNGNIAFTAKVDFTTGTSPHSVSIGDFDGDGKSDLAVANQNSNTISLFRNTSISGTVSFAAKIDFTTGTQPYSVISGDIDGDGKPDLAVANLSSNTVSVFRNSSFPGTISFAIKVDFATASNPISVGIGDMDGDGKPDLAVANNGSNTVSVLRNTSVSGTVSFATKVDFTSGVQPVSISIGDLDGDGKVEMAEVNLGSGTVSVFRNTSSPATISFAARLDFSIGFFNNNPGSVIIVDMDGDGKPEMSVGDQVYGIVAVFRNNCTPGTIGFYSPVNTVQTGSSNSIDIGDIDGDGKPDLAVANVGINTVSVVRSTSSIGNISFASNLDFATGNSPQSVIIGDIDGDGKPDLVTANTNSNTVSVIRQIIPIIITSFTPSAGCINTSVVITGSNFTGATAVTFGGTNALSFTVNSSTQITAIVGNNPSGTIVVSSPITSGVSSGVFSVSNLPIAPVASSNSPVCAGTSINLSSVSTNLFVVLSTSGTHSLGIKSDGTLWAWGTNNYGQFGTGNTSSSVIPVQVGNATDWVNVACGGYFSIALKGNGSVWSWGRNDQGQLGDGTTTLSLSPVTVIGLTGVTAIAAGTSHSLATTGGIVKSWGNNTNGQLGDGTTTMRTTPVTVTGLSGITAIAAGDSHSLAIQGGIVKSWGKNANGQLGDGTTTQRVTPVNASGLSGVTAIAAGANHSLAIISGSVKSWGFNSNGQLGDGTTTQRTTPVIVSGLLGITAIAAGSIHSLAITGGIVKSWGYNAFGQLGDGTTTQRTTPVTVSGLSGVTLISSGTGSLSSFAITGGIGKSWGQNQGLLGDGTTVDRLTPVNIVNSYSIINYNWTGPDNFVLSAQNPTITNSTTASAGTYSVVAVNDLGCISAPATTSVTINPAPNIGISVSPNAFVCTGTSVTLTATGAVSYSWSGGINNGVSFIPGATTTYTVTGTGANGCTTAVTQTINVLSNYNLVASSGANGSITPNGTTTLCSGANQLYAITPAGGYHILDVLVDGVSNAGAIAVGTYTFSNVTATHTITVTFAPNCTAPLFTVCPGTQTSATSLGLCSNAVSYTSATSGTIPTVTYAFSGATTGSGNGDGSGSTFNTGTTTVALTATNGCGIASCNFNILVTDNQAPVANITILPIITGQCSASAIAPTATDNCSGTITGTTIDALSYSTQGTFTIHWTYNDGNGNTSTQNQTVIVADNLAPVANVSTLPTITGQCTATTTTPTATDNCAGVISGITVDPTSYSAQGTYTIHWTYNDGNGNTSTQTQTVVVADVTAPVADLASLPTVTGQCSATVTAPTAADNCVGLVTGTTASPMSYTAQGTYSITWAYNDGNGNTSTQTQTVVVADVTAPVANVASLPTVSGQCSATATAPTATDNCAGSVTGTTTDPTSYNAQGAYTITWSYNDGNGNSSTQTQSVFVLDNTPPSIAAPADVTVCSLTATTVAIGTATGSDNCGTVTFSNDAPGTFPIGTTSVIWTADDGNGNTATATQNVTVNQTPIGLASDIVICNGDPSNLPLSADIMGTTFTWTSMVTAGGVIGNGSCSSGCTSTISDVLTNTGFVHGVVTYTVTPTSPDGCVGPDFMPTITVGAAPATPVISGPSVVCNMTTATYSVVPVPEAMLYTWTVPTGVTGMTITSGQGTPTITVTISAGTVIGNVTCQTSNNCLPSNAAASMAVTKKPAVPGLISGPTSTCGQTTASYSIASVFGATSYAWTVPANMTITSGQGTTAISVSMTTAFVYGQVKVSAVNNCGNIPGTALNVTGNVPPAPVTVSGPSNVCGLTTATYSIAPVTGATGYNWTITGAGTIIGSNTGTSVTVALNGTSGGSISCASTNACANGTARTLNLVVTATVPSVISGPTTICGVNTATYSVSSLGAGYTYNWSLALGTGWTITAGQGTPSITISGTSISTNPLSGLVKVTSTNGCGMTSAFRSMAVTYCHDGIAMSGTETNSNTFSNIYPNPTSSEFTIDVTSDVDKDVTVEVYDVLGNLVIHAKHQLVSGTNTMKTNIEDFENGMYFVRLLDVDSNVIHSQTVIKQ